MSHSTTRSLLLGITSLSLLLSPLAGTAASVSQNRLMSRPSLRQQPRIQSAFDTSGNTRLNDLRRRMNERRTAPSQTSTSRPTQITQPLPGAQQLPQPTVSNPAPTAVDGNIGSIRQQILDLVNAERQKAGLQPVVRESRLETAAQSHAQDMASRNYFEHNTPEGQTPTQQMQNAGYPLTGRWSTGQNIARGQTSAQQVMQDWMNSPGHRQNILNPAFQELGVGYVNNYWVQDFGSHQ